MVDRSIQSLFLVDIYLVNANKRNTSTRCEVGQWRRSGIFIANSVHISHLGLVFLLQTLNMLLQAGLAHTHPCYPDKMCYFFSSHLCCIWAQHFSSHPITNLWSNKNGIILKKLLRTISRFLKSNPVKSNVLW